MFREAEGQIPNPLQAEVDRLNAELHTVQSQLNKAEEDLQNLNDSLENLFQRDACVKKAFLNPLMPIFCIIGSDKCAKQIIEIWAWIADAVGAPAEKTTAARQKANDIRNWQSDNPDMVKIPD